MPYQSEAQRRFMHARHPKIAKRWDEKYGSPKDLPERKGKKHSKAFYDAASKMSRHK